MHYLPFLLLLLSCIRLLSFLVIRVFRWLIQTLRDGFPAFDDWVKTSYNPVAQKFKVVRGAAILIIMALFFAGLWLLAKGYRYIFWIKPYFRDRRAAADPETDPERLRKLSEGVNPNPLLCRVIAHNPNTPLDVLLKLGEKFPKQLFANPIFDLLLLEDPNLLKTMPRGTLKSLLRLKAIPVSFLEQVVSYRSRDAELIKVIAKHPKTPKYILEKIAHHH